MNQANKNGYVIIQTLMPFFVVLTLSFGLVDLAQAVTVCKDGSCDETSIAAALNDPQYSGQTVVVKPDTYNESDLSVYNRTLQSDDPNSPAATIIDATGSNNPVIKVAANATIRGFTITGGNNTDQAGGGIGFGGDIVLRNLIIENNQAGSVTSTYGGGGVGGSTSSSVQIIDSIIRNNTAPVGGGIYHPDGQLTITNSAIEGNVSVGNSVGSGGGGGIVTGKFNILTIENTSITGNIITGGVFRNGGGLIAGGVSTLNNVTIQNNSAAGVNGSHGGGIHYSGGRLQLNGGSVSGNQAYQGGGIYISAGGKVLFSGSAVTGNTALENIAGSSGGGVLCQATNAILGSPSNVSGNSPGEFAGCGDSVNPPVGTTRSPADSDQSGTSNDPINTFTGDYFDQFELDINLGGPLPLYFSRYFSSGFISDGIFAHMGGNWRHNFDWKLSVIGGSTINIVNHQGRTIQFIKNGLNWDLNGKADIVYQLVENAGMFTLLDPRNQYAYTFDIGLLTSVEDGHGNTHSISYTNSLVTQVSDGLGRTLNFSYDSNQHLTDVDDGLGRVITFEYTADYLTASTDLLDNTTTYDYVTTGALKDLGLMIRYTRPEGNSPFWQAYYADGKVYRQRDANLNDYLFAYNASNTTIEDPLGNTRVHTHTSKGEFSNRQDEDGQSFSMGSDTTGRRNSMTDRLGATTTIIYDTASGKVGAVTNADGSSYSNTYSGRTVNGLTRYDLANLVHTDATNDSIIYDANGNPTSHTDRAGNTSTATYNSLGQALTSVNVAGGVVTNTYNADATLNTMEDPAGHVIEVGYDTSKRANILTYADTTTQILNRDDAGNVLDVTDENNNTVVLAYDSNQNISTVTDPLLNLSTFTYDGNDRLLSILDPLNGTTSQTYNFFGKVASATDANGNTTTYSYNSLGRLTSVTDPSTHEWTTTYDAENIIASSTDPLLNTTNFTSDNMGRITQVTSPLSFVESVTYDVMGEVMTETDQLNNATAIERDARGLLSSISLPGNTIVASYNRNAFGDFTRVVDPGGNHWNYTYDNFERLTSSTDPLSNMQAITYDNRNRPASTTFPGALGSLTLAHDFVGNLTSKIYSDGTSHSFIYDANDRLTAATGITLGYDANNQLANSNGIVIARDTGGRFTTMTLAAGKTLTYVYDANDRVTQIDDWAGGITTFVYDAAGRLTSITRPNGVNATKTYDNDSRLTGLTEGALSSISLTLDAKGQTTGATRNVPQVASASGLSNFGHSVDAASQLTTATYDALGRTTNEGVNSYVWNLASELVSMTTVSGTTTATFNALGHRVSKTTGGITRSYLWNYALDLESISIEKQAGSDLRYYVHTPSGALIYSIDAITNARHFYHYDEMGNTLFITNDAGSVVASYAYTVYGKLIGSSGALDNVFTWQGQFGVMNEGSGLYYIRARYYDANTARFISRDQTGSIHPLEINPYQYALANPLQFVDVDGNQSLKRSDQLKDEAEKTTTELFKIGKAATKAKADVKTAKSRLNRATKTLNRLKGVGTLGSKELEKWKAAYAAYQKALNKSRKLEGPWIRIFYKWLRKDDDRYDLHDKIKKMEKKISEREANILHLNERLLDAGSRYRDGDEARKLRDKIKREEDRIKLLKGNRFNLILRHSKGDKE